MITRKLTFALPVTFVFLVLVASQLQAAQVRLTWVAPKTSADGTPLSDLAGYKVYYGQKSGQYPSSKEVGNQTSYTLTGLVGGQPYYIAVTAKDTSGNESAHSNEVYILVPPDSSGAPIANFTATSTVGSAPWRVVFTDTSTGSITSWFWTFGDGSTSTTRSPTYTYQKVGTFTVSLKVTGPGGFNTQTKSGFVTALPTGLVAAYAFNEGSGITVKDVSGKGDHGTISGATWTSSGRYGKALVFDGANAWVTVKDASSLDLTTGMTLAAWVYPTVTPSGWRALIVKEMSGSTPYYLRYSIAFSQPFRVAPVVVTAHTNVQEASAVTGRPARVSRKGFQFHLRQQGLSQSPDAAQTVSYIAWEPSTGTFDGFGFEVNKTPHVRRHQFSTISYKEPFAAIPVFLADIEASGGSGPLNLRWDHKDVEEIDVKIDDAQDPDVKGAPPQDMAIMGYILIR